MRVVVVGATGNVGAATTRALAADDSIDSIVGVARREPLATEQWPGGHKITWRALDISRDPLDIVSGADVVIDLAWKIQPQHDEAELLATNVIGRRRLIDAVLRHDVPALVYASSVGTYAPAPKQPRADESWPPTGISTSIYSRHKAIVESMLDDVQSLHSSLRVVRLRTSLVFQRPAASEVHRLFLGRLLPWRLPFPLRIIPSTPRLQFQATHADDIADAYVRAAKQPVHGAFNIAAEPVLTPQIIAEAVGGRTVPIPEKALRAGAAATFAMHIQPSEAGWLDMATQTPIMDTARARRELGWSETKTAVEALQELLAGIGDRAGGSTPPLHPQDEPPRVGGVSAAR
jgi:nucleoside-diphosphate-sugar epimerase